MSANHGNTPAAWTAVTVSLIGFVVGGIGMSVNPVNFPIFWIGIALVVAAGLAYVVMAKLGLNE